ncbi:MAG: BON domain-containing protein [Candidatus Nucleicultricaceae bacterium]
MMKIARTLQVAVSWTALTGYMILSTGCEPVMVVGTGAAVTTSVAEERGIGGVLNDSSIKTRIQVRYMEHNPALAKAVDVVVRQGRVLLTGTLNDPKMQIDAVRLAWKVDGVQEVIDETSIGGNNGFGAYANDSWITTQIKSKMLFNKNIQSLNYNIQSIRGTVYVMGIAQSQRELDRVIDIARRTSKVKRVVSYVTLKPQSIGAGAEKGHVIHPPAQTGKKKQNLPPVDYSESEDLAPAQSSSSDEDIVDVESLDEPNTDSAFQ